MHASVSELEKYLVDLQRERERQAQSIVSDEVRKCQSSRRQLFKTVNYFATAIIGTLGAHVLKEQG
jgi:hypothetical protein